MRTIRPVPIPEAARPFAVPMGPGAWTWRWGGWTVEGNGGRILRVARGETDVLGEVAWPAAGIREFAALPGRLDGPRPDGREGDGLTLLLPPGGEAGVLIAGGEGVGDLVVRGPAGGDPPEPEPGPEDPLTTVLPFPVATSSTGARTDALPMHAHRALRAALETAHRGLAFRAPGIDAGHALFWATGPLGIRSTSGLPASAASPGHAVLDRILADLALGREPPESRALEGLLRLDPVAGLRAVSLVGEWRDAPGTLAALEGPVLKAGEALTAGGSGAAPDPEAVSALHGAAAALEGAGMRHAATAIRGWIGPAPAPRPIVGRPEALEEIRTTVETFARAPAESVCDEAPRRRCPLRLPATILFGFLGATGDAPFGRLRLAPTLGPGIDAFEADGIRLGAARVRARYRPDGAGHTFTVNQSDGPVPVDLALDLGLPSAPERTWIDGKPAEIELAPSGTGVRVRVRVPLDRTREVRIEGPGEVPAGNQPPEER